MHEIDYFVIINEYISMNMYKQQSIEILFTRHTMKVFLDVFRCPKADFALSALALVAVVVRRRLKFW